MLSIQTNVTSLVAQQNLNTNNTFQSKTIQQLTSGFRINSAGDDAAGLAVANGFRNSVSELTQGVQNANNGVASLQIMDGGLSNISNILDRLQTLATESASTTFTGNRTTLNNEYQTLLGEINRQATNIGLNTGGTNVTNQQTYIGGASSANSNAEVSVNLVNGAVDTTGLKLSGTSVIGGGVGFANDTTNLNDPSATFLSSTGGGAGSETFTFNYVDAAGVYHNAQTITIAPVAGGYSGTGVITAVNNALTNAGITNISASIGSSGAIQFSGPAAFTVNTASAFTNAPAAGNTSTSIVNGAAATFAYNTGVSTLNAAANLDAAGGSAGQVITFSVGGDTFTYTLKGTDLTTGTLATSLNAATDAAGHTLNSAGVYAVAQTPGSATGNILLTSASAFTVDNATQAPVGKGGLFTSTTTIAAAGNQAVAAPNAASSATGQALLAINAVTAAVQTLGNVQGIVGAGENQLNYAISLAQSQITNFDSAQSQIRDTDVAAQAANLSKAQVLQQASIAAMAQANSAPQQVLALLRQ
jgi:flagellin